MKYTSSAANKKIKKLQAEKELLLNLESLGSVYYQVDDKSEPAEYDYKETSKKITKIDNEVAKIKHAVNVFNATTKLKDSDLTVDEALVRLAQMNQRKAILDMMRKRLPKQRKIDRYGSSSNLVEYVCVNYSLDKVNDDYLKLEDKIQNLQMKIDYINQTEEFEI